MDKYLVKDFSILFSQLNVVGDEAKIVHSLMEEYPQTVLKISQSSGIARTTCYRLLNNLTKRGLVHEVLEENTTMFAPASVTELERLLEEKAGEVDRAKGLLSDLEKVLGSAAYLQQPGTEVRFYRGKSGIQQMGWNTLQAKKVFRGFSYREYAEIVGEKFDRDWEEEFIARGLFFKEIYSDAYIESRPDDEIVWRESWIESRYVSPEVLDINHQMDIYNDIVAFYNWYEGEVYGVEIHDEKIARFHKQLFDLVWENAEKKGNDLTSKGG